jgi:hypothetical protein
MSDREIIREPVSGELLDAESVWPVGDWDGPLWMPPPIPDDELFAKQFRFVKNTSGRTLKPGELVYCGKDVEQSDEPS